MTIRTFTAPLVGMVFRPPAQDVVNMLPAAQALRIELQDDNPYDPDAIQVLLDGFVDDDTNLGKIFRALREIYSAESPEKLELFTNPLQLGFIANSEKTGGKFASTIKSYMQLDGRNTVPCKLTFDARSRAMLSFEWDSEEVVPDSQKIVATESPLAVAEKTGPKPAIDDEIPF